MNEKTVRVLLVVTGAFTMLAGLQFLAPTLFLKAAGLEVGDPTGFFFARHWGLLCFCIGALLVYAASHAEVRRPIVMAACAEKLGITVMLAMNWSETALNGLHPAALVDGVCVVFYLVYLLRVPTRRPH
jgi:hypothetical protein